MSTVFRGYGVEHKRMRAYLAGIVAGGQVPCARCGRKIAPGEPWDLGHLRGDRSRWGGPEHRRCNRDTRSKGVRQVSRDW
jgi:hypothetical protein